jgi:hypothetical protein
MIEIIFIAASLTSLGVLFLSEAHQLRLMGGISHTDIFHVARCGLAGLFFCTYSLTLIYPNAGFGE